MKVYRDGNTYKVAKIAGPRHNFLSLVLSMGPQRMAPTTETTSVNPLGIVASISRDEVLKQVMEGVAEANRQCKSSFAVDTIRFVSTDTPDDAVYVFLAKRIIEDAVKNLSEYGK